MKSVMLRRFLRQSNLIEGIEDDPSAAEIAEATAFLNCPIVSMVTLEALVDVIAHADLRDEPGMDVQVGDHYPPPGGPGVRAALEDLLADVNAGARTPWSTHMDYEELHPFMDGNGRSGRLLWVWQMMRDGKGWDGLPLGFLHAFYYQTLSVGRE